MDVSVIVTAYNQADVLSVTMPLLRAQRFGGDWEIIICDDGSVDSTYETVRAIFGAPSHDWRYISRPHGSSPGRVRNSGLRSARGKLIVHLDGDIAVGPNFIEEHVAEHSTDEMRIVYGTRRWLFLDDLPSQHSIKQVVAHLLRDNRSLGLLFSEEPMQRKYDMPGAAWFGCMSCNLSVTRGPHVYFDEAFVGWGAEDTEFACRLALRHGYRLCFRPFLCGLHLERDSARRYSSVRPKTHAEIVQYIKNVIHFKELYPEVDLLPVCAGLGFFELDELSDTWRRAETPSTERAHIFNLLSRAEEYVACH